MIFACREDMVLQTHSKQVDEDMAVARRVREKGLDGTIDVEMIWSGWVGLQFKLKIKNCKGEDESRYARAKYGCGDELSSTEFSSNFDLVVSLLHASIMSI